MVCCASATDQRLSPWVIDLGCCAQLAATPANEQQAAAAAMVLLSSVSGALLLGPGDWPNLWTVIFLQPQCFCGKTARWVEGLVRGCCAAVAVTGDVNSLHVCTCRVSLTAGYMLWCALRLHGPNDVCRGQINLSITG
jgi:hypothetical protein